MHGGKKKKRAEKNVTKKMSSSHSGLVKDSLDRPVRLKDIKHSSRSLLSTHFFVSFLFSLFWRLIRLDFFCKKVMEENGKGGDEKRDRGKVAEDGRKMKGEERKQRWEDREEGEVEVEEVVGGVREGAQSCHFTTGEMNDFLPLDTGP